MTGFSEHVRDENYMHVILLTEREPGTLDVTVDAGDHEATLRLDADGIRKLRLALTRFERSIKRTGTGGDR